MVYDAKVMEIGNAIEIREGHPDALAAGRHTSHEQGRQGVVVALPGRAQASIGRARRRVAVDQKAKMGARRRAGCGRREAKIESNVKLARGRILHQAHLARRVERKGQAQPGRRLDAWPRHGRPGVAAEGAIAPAVGGGVAEFSRAGHQPAGAQGIAPDPAAGVERQCKVERDRAIHAAAVRHITADVEIAIGRGQGRGQGQAQGRQAGRVLQAAACLADHPAQVHEVRVVGDIAHEKTAGVGATGRRQRRAVQGQAGYRAAGRSQRQVEAIAGVQVQQRLAAQVGRRLRRAHQHPVERRQLAGQRLQRQVVKPGRTGVLPA